MRISKRVLSIVLSLLMAFTMMPFTAFAADDPYADIKNTTTVITFDNKQWYLIDYDDSTVTLLAKECVGASKFGTNQTYSGSTVETFVNTWYTNNITGDAKTAVNENGMFLLTTDQANATTADVKKCSRVDGTGGNYWWLCSPGNNQFRAARVNGDNGDVNGDGWNITYVFGVRPALKLDLSKVEFDSETNTFAEPTPAVPKATVTEATAPEGAAFAYKFEADAAKPTAYDAYHADFVATFDRDVKAGEVTLYGKYGDYGWVELTINEDVPAGTPYRIYKNLMNDTLTYATVRDEVSPFYCGAGGAVLADTNMTVNFVLYPVEGGTEGAPVEASEDVTGEIEKPAVPMATVTEVTAPEGAAFAYKFEADAAKPTAYDNYHADFVATFDRDIKAGEVTLYGKYGDYGWVELTINEDVPAGTPYRIYKNLMNDTLTYATVRDEVSPFYCGAGGAVLADTNMTVNFVLYPVEGGTEGAPVEASEAVTGEIEKPEVKDKYSITINDKVELNVLIEETDVTKLGVKYNKTPDEENDGTPAEAEIISVSSLTKQDNYYVVNVPLAPAQIRDVITIDVYKGDNLDRTISTSVANYCEAIVNDHAYTGDNAALVEALAQATLDYGKAASDYFGYNTDAYAGYSISNNTLPSLSGLVANDTTGLITGVRYVAKSVPELRFETSLTEVECFDDKGNALYSVSCAEGYAAKFAKVGDTVVIEVKGIPASKLGEAIHLNVSGKVNGAIEYTPLAFSSVASRSSDNNLKALGIAIANYSVAAANLF